MSKVPQLIFDSDPRGHANSRLRIEAVGDVIELEIDNPWYGSTEDGFGATLIILLDFNKAKNLMEGLSAWIRERENLS